MEKDLFIYLNFLLPTHNCVIIPNLGAFILNLEDSAILDNGEIRPPKYSITFNPEITHNDGILSSYIIKTENIHHNAASTRIKDSVKKIKSDLKSGKSIICGNIGSLIDIDDNIIFTPNRNYNHPDYFGLYYTKIKRIEDINKYILKEKRQISLKYLSGGVAAAVAAMLLFITPSININNDQESIQKANFLSAVTSSLTKKNNEAAIISFPKAEILKSKQESNQVQERPTRIYYIIVGGEESRNRADILLSKIQKEDFGEAAIVESPDRYRIYIASFSDKKEAETFLEGFRKDNPKYGTAWLLSKKNN